jgi:hypothetical protein
MDFVLGWCWCWFGGAVGGTFALALSPLLMAGGDG